MQSLSSLFIFLLVLTLEIHPIMPLFSKPHTAGLVTDRLGQVTGHTTDHSNMNSNGTRDLN